MNEAENRLFNLPPTETPGFFTINLSADRKHSVPFYWHEPKDLICQGLGRPTPIDYIDEDAILIVAGKPKTVFSEITRHTKECVYAQLTGLKSEKLSQYNGHCYFIDKGFAVRNLPEKPNLKQIEFTDEMDFEEMRKVYEADDEFPF